MCNVSSFYNCVVGFMLGIVYSPLHLDGSEELHDLVRSLADIVVPQVGFDQ